MPIIALARPFTLIMGYGVPKLRFGIGIYDCINVVFDAIVGNPVNRWHTETEVVARGDPLVQNRAPVPTWAPGDRYFTSLTRVTSIEPGPILLWRWPPHLPQDWTFGPDVIPAPGVVVQLREMEPVEGSENAEGEVEWRHKLRLLNYPPSGHYAGHGTPVGHRPQVTWPFPDARVGDTITLGVPPTVPLKQLDTLPPAHPPEDPITAMHRRMQADAVRQAQTGTLLRQAHIAAARALTRVVAGPRADPEAIRARYGARASVHPDFRPAEEGP
jgi:hypothetical protein